MNRAWAAGVRELRLGPMLTSGTGVTPVALAHWRRVRDKEHSTASSGRVGRWNVEAAVARTSGPATALSTRPTESNQ